MAIKVEVLTPTVTVSEGAGPSTAIVVTKPSNSPITTNGTQAVVNVVSERNIISGIVVAESNDPPDNPHEGMVWAGYTL